MPWHEASTMSVREEFVVFAQEPDCNFADLCDRYDVSRKTGYKWEARYLSQGRAGLEDHSRRPQHSPMRTAPEVEERLIAVRQCHTAWGARKIAHYAVQQGLLTAAQTPSPSTITAILRRHGLLDPEETPKHQAWQRFEHPVPNALWQMDFKGDLRLKDAARRRVFPLTVLDDHSRFSLGLRACLNEQKDTVQGEMTEIFRRYGLPDRITMDNGSPWGDTAENAYTAFTVWLLRLGVGVSHSRPYHPQTQGKDERFHRTLQVELLKNQQFADAASCQRAFDEWRQVYNHERPHQALGFAVPASRYRLSERPYPEQLPSIEYGPDDEVRKIQQKGEFHFQGRVFRVSRGFTGYPIALRPTLPDGVWRVYFCEHQIAQIDLRSTERTK